jgi:hypothetical protein
LRSLGERSLGLRKQYREEGFGRKDSSEGNTFHASILVSFQSVILKVRSTE